MNDVGRYRKLYARLWRHPGFAALSEGEKIVALYVLTGPQTNRLGLYCLSIATAAEDLGTSPETLKKRLVNVCQTFGWLFDADARVFYVPTWFKWNPPENVNVMKGSLKDLNEIPPCGLVDAFARNIETLPETLHVTFLEGLRQRLPKGYRTQEPYQDLNQKPDQKPSALRAVAARENAEPNSANRIETIARGVARDFPKQEIEHQIDTLQNLCFTSGIECTRQQAITALGAARVA